MDKLEKFEGKQTNWQGLWWHPEYNGFSSGSISLAELKKFKGNVRFYMYKNKKADSKINNQPDYLICLKDSQSPTFQRSSIFRRFEVEGDCINEMKYDKENDCYYDKKGERLYTYDEVQHAINEATYDTERGYTDNIVRDYLPIN